MIAYYNEHDSYAAQWLRNLIAAGHIAPGIVDDRDIRDVTPAELIGFTQCHFFAGIGVWSHALRRTGWSDDRPVWTGSCPCQPFSAAGARGGVDDERHLWPHWFWLIEQCRPPVVLGEQVASKDGLGWLDLVSADLEGARYAVGASDLCAAGFGGAHIRQRLYFVGLADSELPVRRSINLNGQNGRDGADDRRQETHGESGTRGQILGLDDDDDARPQGHAGDVTALSGRQITRSRPVAETSLSGRLGDASDEPRERLAGSISRTQASVDGAGFAVDGGLPVGSEHAGPSVGERSGAPMLGRSLADWLFCRDGKWRPVRPGSFPLVAKAPARGGRLRAYGNGLDAETATGFVQAVREITG